METTQINAVGRAARSTSLLALAALVVFAAGASAQAPAVDVVTFGQPKVVPYEFNGDLSRLSPAVQAISAPKAYRPLLQGPRPTKPSTEGAAPAAPSAGPLAPMPSPIQNFAGLSFDDDCTGGTCGAGWPPDPNGDVGPNDYVEAVNTAIAIYSKTGTLLASFTEDNLWSGVAGSLCNGNSQGDPIVTYDRLADRFVLSWFAFGIDPSGNPVGPFYQCIAASKTNDPVAGGWWLYPIRMDVGLAGPPVGDLNDYVKVGMWDDCMYLSANAFSFPGGSYDGVMFGSLSRADMYAGDALTYALGWLPPASNAFTLMPANNLGTGANSVQAGTPEYFVSEAGTSNAFEVRKFTAGSNCGAGGTLSAPTLVSQAPYLYEQGGLVPQPNTTQELDMIDDRIMQKAWYRKIGSTESLWVTHPVGVSQGHRGALMIAMQWAQLDITGGTIAAAPVQQQIYTPDLTLYRFMGSLAVDSQGNMALGYTTSNQSAPNFPSVAYSGRLATDPANLLPQSEVQMKAGSGSQENLCGGAPCIRWGDYSGMSVDPADDCTFWYVNEYYSSQANGSSGNWQTQIGSFKFPSCGGLPGTTTMLISSLNPSTVGATVTFTASVTGTNPTGNVNFTADGTSISGCGTAALTVSGNTRNAQCSTNALTQATHSIIANYGGDSGNAPSASTPLSQVVNSAGVSINVALAANSGVASASSTYSASFPVAAINNGDRAGLNWGNGGGWNDATFNVWPDWVQINFSGPQTIDHVIVYTLQDNYANPVDPPDNLTFTLYGVTAFQVQGWSGSAWVNLGAAVSGNNLVKRTVAFPAYTTSRIRVYITNALDGFSRLTEVEAWTSTEPPPSGTTLSSSANPAKVTQSVTFTATVTGTNPSGSVAFTNGGSPIAGCSTVALTGSGNSKTAQCATSFAVVATYSIGANYGGDGTNPPSAATPLSEVIVRKH